MAAEIRFPITTTYFPQNHQEIEKIVSKKSKVDLNCFADLYIYFKSKALLEAYKLDFEGVFTTKCYWTPDFFLRVTFYDQKREENPHTCIDLAIAKIAKTIVLQQQEDTENKASF